MSKFHLFKERVDKDTLPECFNNPFSYRPHGLCVNAADEVRHIVLNNHKWRNEVAGGKMFGVLVVRNNLGEYGYLSAFSGLLDGCNEHDFFVPAVFDYLNPDGYFKCEERRISFINEEIVAIETDPDYIYAVSTLNKMLDECEKALATEREAMREGKKKRDKQRNIEGLSSEMLERLLNESRFAKAEYKRNVKRWNEKIAVCKESVGIYERRISVLRDERKIRSIALQQWLFDNYIFLNAEGQSASLSDIFATYSKERPPAGAGECAAPKLLQYAFANALTPIAMAEFWIGKSPVGEVRRDGCFYASCISKCKPILSFMLQGMEVEPLPSNEMIDYTIEILYEDDYLLAINKPSGILSVPGIIGGVSIEELLKRKYGKFVDIRVIHRLDMATSGILLVAKSMDIYKKMQREFAERHVTKRYIALLDAIPALAEGEISLPLSSDFDNRPRQKVDYVNGKLAVTRYKLLEKIEYNGHQCAKVAFYPLTGRTHQLRVHAAHVDGLNVPIVGDELYGVAGVRLMLHAEFLSFIHPVTKCMLSLESKCEF